MSGFDRFRLDGRRALVVGGATGMGGATARVAAEAGADVVVLDRVAADGPYIAVDLAERSSIDRALDDVGGPVDVVFACAGVADGTPGIERINFIGHRYLIDQLRERGWLGRGAAIGMISSAAGLGWEATLDETRELLAIHEWDEAVTWVADHGRADYLSMKRVMCAYVAAEALPMLRRGIRINAICPGPTDTPLARANAEMWLDFGSDYRAEAGIQASDPAEQASLLVFLCTPAASAVTGQTVVSDAGYLASGLAGSYPAAADAAAFLYGRLE